MWTRGRGRRQPSDDKDDDNDDDGSRAHELVRLMERRRTNLEHEERHFADNTFKNANTERQYLRFSTAVFKRRVLFVIAPWLLLALVQIARAHAFGADGRELAWLYLGAAVVFASLGALHPTLACHLPIDPVVLVLCVLAPLCANMAVYSSSARVEAACEGRSECLIDTGKARALFVGLAVPAYYCTGVLCIRVFWHALAALVAVNVHTTVLFLVLRNDIGDSVVFYGLCIGLMSVVSLVANHAIDGFFRKEFMWFSQTLRMASDHLDKLEQAKSHKQRIVAYLFHEVRNPINNIVLASAEALALIDSLHNNGNSNNGANEPQKQQQQQPPDNEHQQRRDDNVDNLKEMVGIVSQAATTASHVLDDALSLEKLEAGNFAFVKKPFALGEVYIPTVQTMMPQFMRKKIRVEVVVEQQVSELVVLGDLKRLQQVVFNFLSNAAKFTPEGGVVQLKVVALAFREDQNPPTVVVRLHVSDDGIGIPAEHQASLFTAWAQVRAAETQGGGGTGLGLSLSKDFVQRGHNGRVGMSSPGDLGTGSTFFFEIPFQLSRAQGDVRSPLAPLRSRSLEPQGSAFAASYHVSEVESPTLQHPLLEPFVVAAWEPGPGNDEPATSRTQSDSPSGGDGGAGRDDQGDEAVVLVVDDSKITCQLVSRMLRSLGVAHETCANGVEAVRCATNRRYKLILMDKEMPQMDGFEACRRIRQFDQATPIVGVTGNAMTCQQREFLACGATQVVPKPINRATVETLLRQYNVL